MDDPFDERVDDKGFCWVDRLIVGRYTADGRFISRKEFSNAELALVKDKIHAKTFPKRFWGKRGRK